MVIKYQASSTPARLRRVHRGLIFSAIQVEPGISRSNLAKYLGLSEMAVTRIVRELLGAALIEEVAAPVQTPSKRSVGRPKIGLKISPPALYAVGITVSAYHSEVSICDASGTLYASRRFDAFPFNEPIQAARFYAKSLQELIAEADIDVNRIVGVGVALSARTDPERGEIVTSEYFGWSGDKGAFTREIQEIIDLPVQIENISNALAIAEMRFGVARDVSDFVLVHSATFVGASIVSEGRIVRGNRGVSGLIGHFRGERRELACVCGRDDCLNLSATGFGLLYETGKLDHRAFDTGKLAFYASELLALIEDTNAAPLVAAAGARLAPALDSVAKMLDPKMIILSGHLGGSDAYLEGIGSALEQRYDHEERAPYQLVRGAVTSDRSAALLALQAFCYSEQLDFDRFATANDSGGVTYG
ncbi:ROK family transcriptional regulator [Roseovarius sp. C7]|uniref:ROK family transcriptional regulator n=1 Tax=Roseovarius sp. C7 TaxID=3398643 RepID=UPI0039F73720